MRVAEPDEPRECACEVTEDGSLGMLKMRWKKGFLELDGLDGECAECGEWCPLLVVEVAVYSEGAPVCCAQDVNANKTGERAEGYSR